MPSSTWELLPYVCQRIFKLRPKSVLDMGIGFGKYGFLAREYTDICLQRYNNWETRIDGIEVFESYVGDLQRMVYDHVYIGPIQHKLKEVGDYDLIMFLDVIEHLTKEDGLDVLRTIKQKCKTGLVATPRKVAPQPPYNGNEFERHISQWTRRELAQFGSVTKIRTGHRRGIFLLEIRGDYRGEHQT